MSTLLSAVDECDAETRDTVFGFIRDIQRCLEDKDTHKRTILFSVIPDHVIHLCLAFYFIVEEDSFIECGNNHIVISKECKSIANKDSHWDTAYGAFEIDCDRAENKVRVFRWTFEVHNHAHNCISIGIDETQRKWVNTSGKKPSVIA